MTEKNKYGLGRYIPHEVREQIRKSAGFGCVICGAVVGQYEHIDPEFKDAKEHNPEKMTFLCGACHDKVTRGLISKAQVWFARGNPKPFKDGYARDILFVDTKNMEISIGSSTSRNTKTILTINGKPIIWFEPPLIPGEPSKLCAIFYDDAGKAVAYINRNELIALSGNQDVTSEATKLTINANGIKCLQLDRRGGEVFKITAMQARYLNAAVRIDHDGSLLLKAGDSTASIGGMHIENCGSAICLGSPMSVKRYPVLQVAQKIARSIEVVSLKNFNQHHLGWLLNDEVLNHKYEVAGVVRSGRVFSPVGEYIGNLSGSYIVFPDNCYESGEPIYTNPDEYLPIHNLSLGYDVSFRLFGFY